MGKEAKQVPGGKSQQAETAAKIEVSTKPSGATKTDYTHFGGGRSAWARKDKEMARGAQGVSRRACGFTQPFTPS